MHSLLHTSIASAKGRGSSAFVIPRLKASSAVWFNRSDGPFSPQQWLKHAYLPRFSWDSRRYTKLPEISSTLFGSWEDLLLRQCSWSLKHDSIHASILRYASSDEVSREGSACVLILDHCTSAALSLSDAPVTSSVQGSIRTSALHTVSLVCNRHTSVAKLHVPFTRNISHSVSRNQSSIWFAIGWPYERRVGS
jgi:hypothetical protein